MAFCRTTSIAGRRETSSTAAAALATSTESFTRSIGRSQSLRHRLKDQVRECSSHLLHRQIFTLTRRPLTKASSQPLSPKSMCIVTRWQAIRGRTMMIDPVSTATQRMEKPALSIHLSQDKMNLQNLRLPSHLRRQLAQAKPIHTIACTHLLSTLMASLPEPPVQKP